nr:MBL fold metallo-hydrolase [Synechococcus sp. CBW1107]
MDPVLFDPHQEGLFAICPSREVDTSALPALDAIVISHRHLDHFDVHSLAVLPRDLLVICPEDPLIISALEQLGFEDLEPVHDWSTVPIGPLTLLMTPSKCPVPEFGILVAGPEGTLWNQVDTIVSMETVKQARAWAGGVDLLMCGWQPMLESAYLWNRSISFPAEEYARLLSVARKVDPSAIVPASCGFRYLAPAEHLNRVVFPVTHERFVADVSTLMPHLAGKVHPLFPGDSITMGANGTHVVERQEANWVRMKVDDRSRLDFMPNQVDRILRAGDPPDDESDESWIRELLQGPFQEFLQHRAASTLLPMLEWGVVYQLRIHLQGGTMFFHADFGSSKITVERGREPRATYTTDIEAGALKRLVDGQTTWGAVILGGEYRVLQTVMSFEEGQAALPNPEVLGDPLWHFFPHEPLLQRHVDREVKRWGSTSADAPSA